MGGGWKERFRVDWSSHVEFDGGDGSRNTPGSRSWDAGGIWGALGPGFVEAIEVVLNGVKVLSTIVRINLSENNNPRRTFEHRTQVSPASPSHLFRTAARQRHQSQRIPTNPARYFSHRSRNIEQLVQDPFRTFLAAPCTLTTCLAKTSLDRQRVSR